MNLRTITVRELIDLLEDEDPDARVVFSSDYGDHHHTEQVHAIRGNIEEVSMTPTAYSASGFAVVDADDLDGETNETVLRIR